jgi:hypothetical protein
MTTPTQIHEASRLISTDDVLSSATPEQVRAALGRIDADHVQSSHRPMDRLTRALAKEIKTLQKEAARGC